MMKNDLYAEKCNYPFLKVFYLFNSHYKVTDVKAFYLTAKHCWKVVFNVAFASLHKLHRMTNENYFFIYLHDEDKVDKLMTELAETGELYLSNYKENKI